MVAPRLDRSSQVLILNLWILLILTILAISIGHRVSMALRLSRYQRDRLKSIYLAKAGINRAIRELEKDAYANNYDALNELWASNEDFKEIRFSDKQNEFASVSYNLINDGDDERKIIYGVIDEERKININTASKELLISLLKNSEITDVSKIADNICAWRGDKDSVPSDATDYQGLGYTCKEAKFSNVEELKLVKGITLDVYELIKILISVYPSDGDGKININTVSKDLLWVLIDMCFEKLRERGVQVENPQGLLDAIMDFRQKPEGVFTDTDLDGELENLTDPQKNLLNDSIDGLENKICVKSGIFKIEAVGHISKIARNISTIYDRQKHKIIYWHEN